MANRIMSDDQWISALQECRSSGLTDKDWCATRGINPSTLYKAIKRLRKKACAIPAHEQKIISLAQEVVEVASISEDGILTPSPQIGSTPAQHHDKSLVPYDSNFADPVFETSVRIIMPSGIRIELSNSTDAATIRSILGVLQSS